MVSTPILEVLAKNPQFTPEMRERVNSLSVQLQNLPQDDRLSLTIEALGFAALALKEVPQEVADVVRSIPAGFDEAQREALKADMAVIVDHAIQTPSFDDLRTTLEMMRTHQRVVRTETEGIMRLLGRTHRALKRKGLWFPALGLGLLAGIVSGLLTTAITHFTRTANEEPPSTAIAPGTGLVDYIEAELPEFGGKVGLVLVGGESDQGVLTAFKDGNRGVVVVRPLAHPATPNVP